MKRQARIVRGTALAALVGALVAVPTAAAWGAPTASRMVTAACQPSALPVPDGVQHSEVTGGDHSGRYLAGEGSLFDGTQWSQVALTWVDGRVRPLDTRPLAPYAQIDVTDINSRGTVIGDRMADFTTFRTDAWVYRDGRFTVLPGLKPTDSTRAAAINARGDIVGTSEDLAVDPVAYHAVVWPVDRPGTVRELTVDGRSPRWATGVDIDDDGTVLGLLGQPTADDQQPYVWPARGPGYALASPTVGLAAGAAVHHGWVAGSVMGVEEIEGGAVRWNLRDRTPSLIAPSRAATAVDRYGTVATTNALVYRNGRIRPMDGFVTVLSDDGTAAGTSATFGTGEALVWRNC